MPFGFYVIMAAQFFSSLADNALLVAAISLLLQMQTPEWMTPLLKFFFTVSYVMFAAFVGAFADSMPKGRVMFITNIVKIIGCLMMFFHEVLAFRGVASYSIVLLAYSVAGIGAAAYSPAKYGILTEYLPHHKLVVANGWIEGLTVGSIILGTLLGGVLVSEAVSSLLLDIDIPGVNTGIDTPPEAAIAVIMIFYLIAAMFNLYIPNTGVDHRAPSMNPLFLIRDFSRCVVVLWCDKLGQISLATTTLFWGAGATLQFIVLDWAAKALGFDLSQGTYLTGVAAVGIGAGAVVAARTITLRKSLTVLPVGVAMGLLVISMIFVTDLAVAVVLMIAIGGCAGFFVVPMNALLQHRGHVLMGAGHSIAVQNFNENIGILIMVGLYTYMKFTGVSVNRAVVLFGLLVSALTLLVLWRYFYNQAQSDSLRLIVDESDRRPGKNQVRG